VRLGKVLCYLQTSVWVAALSLICVSCAIPYKQRAPEVLYSKSASASNALQVPPDLTDLSDGEQFVLPGDAADPLKRNTLLPQFRTAKFVREGSASWLEVSLAPESLWPELLAFLRKEGLSVLRTEPNSGLVQTEWMAAVDSGGIAVLKNLLGTDDDALHQRVSFRLERSSADSTTRVFVLVQRASKLIAQSESANQLPWPGGNQVIDDATENQLQRNHDEIANEILLRLKVFLGVAEQKAKGILNDDSAAQVLDSATVTQTAGGAQLSIYRGYRESYRALLESLSALGLVVTGEDIAIGTISAQDTRSKENLLYVLRLDPLHVSEVKVTVNDVFGRGMEPGQAIELLQRIRDQLV